MLFLSENWPTMICAIVLISTFYFISRGESGLKKERNMWDGYAADTAYQKIMTFILMAKDRKELEYVDTMEVHFRAAFTGKIFRAEMDNYCESFNSLATSIRMDMLADMFSNNKNFSTV